ncbi:uncharacterized protein LOC142324888 isoform X1 [Lycorma delicatula]|uniref:uncharacterized protein LOC142324888 isoform X1 n=1 Tax=Lycorma delicatula TaxID=130591 RepID=UPI003F514859
MQIKVIICTRPYPSRCRTCCWFWIQPKSFLMVRSIHLFGQSHGTKFNTFLPTLKDELFKVQAQPGISSMPLLLTVNLLENSTLPTVPVLAPPNSQ